MNNFPFLSERRVTVGVRWYKRVEKVKKVESSVVDLDKVKNFENFGNDVQTPVEDLDAFNYWKNIKEGLGVKEVVETPYYLKGVEVEDLDEPQELKFQRLLKPKPVAEFKSSEKISKLFEVTFYNHFYILIVTTILGLAKTIKKDVVEALKPVQSLIEYVCGKFENLKSCLKVKTVNRVLTVSDLMSCLLCRTLNGVQLKTIFQDSLTVKVDVVDVTIVGSFGDLLLLDELKEIIKALEPLKRFSVGHGLEFKKCEFCSK